MPEDIFTEPELAEPTEIEVGGAILEIPEGATPDTIKTAVENFRASPAFDKLIDKRTGAPAFARAVVGGAPEKDRLANLKRFFPDAVAYGDDNFVFTDPGTGRPTLYNPPGIDFGANIVKFLDGVRISGYDAALVREPAVLVQRVHDQQRL